MMPRGTHDFRSRNGFFDRDKAETSTNATCSLPHSMKTWIVAETLILQGFQRHDRNKSGHAGQCEQVIQKSSTCAKPVRQHAAVWPGWRQVCFPICLVVKYQFCVSPSKIGFVCAPKALLVWLICSQGIHTSLETRAEQPPRDRI